MKSPLEVIRDKFRCRTCGPEDPADSPAIVKMREVNEELEARIEDRYGRDFLEDMIFARESKPRGRNVNRNV